MARRVLSCFLVILLPYVLLAGTVGKIAGIVSDKETGKPLMGVNIVIKETSMGAASGVDGRYFIMNVSPGLYDLEASYIGYAKMTIQNVRVTVDITTDMNFEMSSETIQGQEVIVIAERPLIEVKSTNERRVIRSEDIENLPVRGASDIVGLQTGVVKIGNDLHVRGGRREEVVYYVDGVYQVNDYNRFDRPEAGEVSSTALEEVSYQAGGFDAEYGSATAGLVNMSTRTGTGRYKLHGEVITDEFLSEEKAYLGTYSYGYNIYNLAIGGPITNKIRFYANGERQFMRDRRTSAGTHPVGTWTGDANEDGIKNYEEYEWEARGGPLPNNEIGKWMGAGNLIFDYKPINLKVGGNFTYENYREYSLLGGHQRSLMSSEHNPLWKTRTVSTYARMTWTINPRTLLKVQGSYFQDSYKTGDPQHWEDFMQYGMKELPYDKFLEIYGANADSSLYGKNEDGWIVVQPQLYANGSNPRVLNEYAEFFPNGTIWDDYEKNETGYLGINANLKTQVGDHEVNIGGEFRDYTVRYYRIGAPMRLASGYIGNPPLSEDEYDTRKYSSYDEYVEQYWFLRYKNAYAENMGYTIDGMDYINESVKDNRDGPRTPKVGGLFIQDKVELRDLVINMGLRYDYISPDNRTFVDNALIVIDSLGQIAETVYFNEDGVYNSYAPTYSVLGEVIDSEGRPQLEDSKIHHIISPRLGLAFPVTDRTVFHAQYGKYVQQPQLNRMFLSYLRFAANLEQGNFTISGNPALEPVKTTSYELGFKQQLGMNASIDMTVFYKQLTGYVQVRNVIGARPIIYATYVNGDYGTVKGLSLSFHLRRTGYIQAMVNYTLQYAGGTGSTANGQYRIAWQSGNYPTYVCPLDFDQRHTGNVNIDFRTTEKDLIGKAGINLLFTFGSGRPYTPTKIDSYVFPSISDRPIAAINSGVMPFSYQLNMKLDKSIGFKGVDLTFFLWIQNLLNTKNVRDVHDGTGLANYDGWFDTDNGKKWLEDPDNNVDVYNMRQNHPLYYETPRTIRFGVQFDLG